ncbi:DNA-directed RNA polymerase specialized sigma24 family protein [Chitinophaga skermanii]|uniref:DNA-directed RNA polymerase specialized sigma24 family protein n=1 Tax=Chitinophaga skermanii TaxID=331697 RepID=A0A327QQN3_9BACT|nr:sigma-70 family RNA polymerase sigma factor [Chitinophaga skermanii]RAJ06859.1 DNA-directed RNA polymerase specialized sigma24 family protein [Chitinophaga skermanii]
MQLLLQNLPDKELISRVKRSNDREAAAVLLSRYSHLLAAVCLPKLNKEKSASVVYPSLLQYMNSALSVQSIYKVNEWMQQIVHAYFSRNVKSDTTLPSRQFQALYRLENRVDNAGNNPIEKEALLTQLKQALKSLNPDELYIAKAFYADQKSFDQIATSKDITIDKVRNTLKGVKKKIALTLMDQAYEQ